MGNVTDPRSRVCLACLNESGERKGDSESRAERNRDKREAPLDASLASSLQLLQSSESGDASGESGEGITKEPSNGKITP